MPELSHSRDEHKNLPPPYPECERLAAAAVDTQPAGEFVEWLREHGYEIAERSAAPGCGVFGLRPCMEPLEALFARWKSIDMAEVERERRQMLAELARAR
jgi:hypothetical protein